MIYDCFIFFNELELLELRLNELSGVVDRFVLVEATRTFSNQPKPLHFEENQGRFAAYANKIIHVVVTDSPDTDDAWTIEHFQRNAIARGLVHCRPDDWILVSDLDEIPRAEAVARVGRENPFRTTPFANAQHAALNAPAVKAMFLRKGFRRLLRKRHPFVWEFEQTLHRHYLNCVSMEPRCWHGTRMVRFRDFSCAEEIRHSGYKIVPQGGWHFTAMGGVERIREKVAAFAHQEYNRPEFMDPQLIAACIQRGESLFGQAERLEFVPLDDTFPAFVHTQPEKFAAWIRPMNGHA